MWFSGWNGYFWVPGFIIVLIAWISINEFSDEVRDRLLSQPSLSGKVLFAYGSAYPIMLFLGVYLTEYVATPILGQSFLGILIIAIVMIFGAFLFPAIDSRMMEKRLKKEGTNC